MSTYKDIGVEKVGHVGTIEIRRPPLNFFDISLINQIADALEEFDRDIEIRASVLSAQGKAFCAGANFGDPARQAQEAREAEKTAKGDPADSLGAINHLYIQAVRIFRAKKPIVAAVQGAAIGGGLGLAVSADFRVTCPEARFSANFTKLGFHPGFGLTVTLPELRAVYAAILDPALLRLNTGNFKKAFSPLFASGVLVPVGRRAAGGRVGRPGDLYRFTGPVMGTWERELPWHDAVVLSGGGT